MSDWDEREHPRHPRGTDQGGQFRLAAPMSHLIVATTTPGWVTKVSQRLAGYHSSGSWEPISTEQYRADLHAELSRDLPPEVVDEIFADYDWPAAVYRAGDHVVTIQNPWLARGRGAEILAHLDELQRRFPIRQKIRFAIVPESSMRGDRGTAVPGAGAFYISEETFDDWDRKHPADYVMPVGRKGRGRVEQWRYAMTHEWGHLIDPAAVEHNTVGPWKTPLQTRAQDMVEDWEQHLSAYGRKSWMEATAEAFAEWFLSRGGTQNPAARAYAEWLGWGWE